MSSSVRRVLGREGGNGGGGKLPLESQSLGFKSPLCRLPALCLGELLGVSHPQFPQRLPRGAVEGMQGDRAGVEQASPHKGLGNCEPGRQVMTDPSRPDASCVEGPFTAGPALRVQTRPPKARPSSLSSAAHMRAAPASMRDTPFLLTLGLVTFGPQSSLSRGSLLQPLRPLAPRTSLCCHCK